MTSERAPPTVALAEAQSRRRGWPPALRDGDVPSESSVTLRRRSFGPTGFQHGEVGMRRFIMVTLVIAAFAVVSTAGTANAATRWPARCSNFKCVNAHLNAVHTSFKKFQTNVNGFLNCLDAFPISEYSNFLSDDGTTSRFGLDFTASGDSIQGWFLDIDGGNCGLPGVAAVTGRSPSLAPHSLSLRSVFHP